MVESVKMGGDKLTTAGIDLESRLGQCYVKDPAVGRYTSIYRRNPTHDEAWDRMFYPKKPESKKNPVTSGQKDIYEQRKRVFSFIPPCIWGYKRKGTDKNGFEWKRVGVRDLWGGQIAGKGDATVGQRTAFAQVDAYTGIFVGIRMYLTPQGVDRKTQFQALEKSITFDDKKMTSIFESIASAPDIDTLSDRIIKLRGKARYYGGIDPFKTEDGLADSAAAAAIAAMRQIASLKDKSSKACGSDGKAKYVSDISYWTGRANMWLKVARRLENAQDAIWYSSRTGAADPLFMDKRSSFVCLDMVTQGMMNYHGTGDALSISGPMKLELKLAHEAAFGCEKERGGIICGRGKVKIRWRGRLRCLKKCIPNYGRYPNGSCKPRRPTKCTGGRIRINGRCKCPRGLKWIGGRCKKPAPDIFDGMSVVPR